MANPNQIVNDYPATEHIIYETQFKVRFRDKSILSRITNENYKGRFRNKGTEIRVPVLPLVETHTTRPGAGVMYQDPKGTYESFTIGRERYFAFKLTDEDEAFTALDIKGATKQEGTRQMAIDVEGEFFADVPAKCHTYNQGNSAGIKSGAFDLGSAANPVTLYKCREDLSDAGSGVTRKSEAPDFLVSCINALNEMPGGLDSQPFIIIPVAVANRLQTSEIKRADWMGDQESVLRKGVRYLGRLNGCDVIVDNQIPIWRGSTAADTKYLVYFGDNSAVTFANEANIDDEMKTTTEWGTFTRSKMVYDWFVQYPERIGCGYVKLG